MPHSVALRAIWRYLLVLCLWAATGSTLAQVDAATAEMLMRKSGLWQQLDGLAAQVQAGFDAAQASAPKPPGAEEAKRMKRVIAGAYAPDRLRSAAMRSLVRSVQPAQVDALRKWYESPLGESLTRLEESAALSQTDPVVVMREGSALLEALPSVRRAQYNDMLEATKAAEFATETLINVVMAIQRGAQAAQQGAPLLPPADIKAALDGQRPAMLQAYAALTMASFAITYRQLPAADLSAYVAFLKSDAGRHFNEVSLTALSAALTEASAEFGRGLPATKDAANS